MASEKQILKWTEEAAKINDNPKYIQAYIEYKGLAKRADQRLVRLEALSHDQYFGGVLEFAYKGAIRDIKSWGGDKRFNTAPPTKLTELQAKISDINKFLSKPTSKKSGILKTYKARANTINDRYAKQYGVEFTWQEIANFYGRNKSVLMDKKLGSDTLIRALAVIKRMETDKDLKEIKDVNERIQRVTGNDKILASKVKLLYNQDLKYSDLFGGNWWDVFPKMNYTQ